MIVGLDIGPDASVCDAYPLKGDSSVLAQDNGLREMFVLVCQKVERWPRDVPAKDPTVEQIQRAARENHTFKANVALFTQSWNEYQRLGSQDVLEFATMAVRLLEQRKRGNPNVRNNKLIIDLRYNGLGIYFRSYYPFAAYAADGMLLRTFDGSTPRDLGFVGELGSAGRIRIELGNGILLKATKSLEVNIDTGAAVRYVIAYQDVVLREIPRDGRFFQEFSRQAAGDVDSSVPAGDLRSKKHAERT